MAWNEPNNKQQDPWGKGDQGPPDLEEALKKFQEKIRGLFFPGASKSGGGKNDGSDGEQKKAPGFSWLFLVGIVVVVWAISGIYIVGPAQQAAVLRFGRYVRTAGPGPHWVPRFIERAYVVDVQKVSNFSYNASMLTKDENIVSVAVAIQYRIGNLRDYLFNLVDPQESLQQATASSLRQVVGHSTLDDILTVGRERIRADVNKQLIKLMDKYQAGIEVTDVAMQPAKAPEEVKEAFDDAIAAREDEQRFINQAQAYARGVEPIAKGNAERIMQEARAYKENVTLQAKGDVSKFLAVLPEYINAPKVTRERMYLDAVESVLSRSSKVLVDVKGGNNMLYLPLDKLMATKHFDARMSTMSKPPLKTTSPEQMASQAPRGNSYGSFGMRPGRDAYTGREVN